MFEAAPKPPLLLLIGGAPNAQYDREVVLRIVVEQLASLRLHISDVYEVWTGHTSSDGLGGCIRALCSSHRLNLVLWPGHWAESGRKGASRRDLHMLSAAVGAVTFSHTEPRHVLVLTLQGAGQRTTLERALDDMSAYTALWTHKSVIC